MLLFPTVYQAPRGVLLLFLLMGTKYIGQKYIQPQIFRLWLLNTAFLVFSLLYGLLVGNPGATSTWTVELMWPMLYLIFMMNCHSQYILFRLFKVIIVGGLFVNILNIILLINEMYLGIGALSAFATAMGCMYGIYEGFTEFFVPSADFAPYYLYFGTTLLLLPHKYLNIDNKYIVSLVVTSLALILFSGRRASWLMVALLPIVVLFVLRVSSLGEGLVGKIVSIVLPIAIVLGVGVYYFLNGEYLILEFTSAFDMIENDSNYERTLQAKSLWNDFISSPIFGHGSGYVSAYIRTPDKPWEYELSYNYLLSSRGLVGTLIMILSYLSIMLLCIKKVRNNKNVASLVLPPVTGICCLAIMNETNPYLGKFDFLWIFFLPMIVLNILYFNPNIGRYGKE